ITSFGSQMVPPAWVLAIKSSDFLYQERNVVPQSGRPVTTLFMLMSVDGKISTGYSDERDFDKDIPNLSALASGLKQYEELETQTDLASFNSGKVMAKVGWNEPREDIVKIPVDFIIVDNRPHLHALGVRNLLKRTKRLIIVTTNRKHPALGIQDPNLIVIQQASLNLAEAFTSLSDEGIDAVTVQSGGTLNAELIRLNLIDKIHIVILPALIGGARTPTLVDGDELRTVEDLEKIRSLRLISNEVLGDSYISIKYEVERNRDEV
ncbi:dihydrofolate reductase family protein, partial [Candidatus Saccharibacteria bacterium]|nr:dihydrofolate reductase family protein [Candidatus Saccharibacteria bacterium]